MEVVKPSLPKTFGYGKSSVIEAIAGLVMIFLFVYCGILFSCFDKPPQSYYYLAAILFIGGSVFQFCLKIFLFKIEFSEPGITLRNWLGRRNFIAWRDIGSVTLKHDNATVVVKGHQNTLTLPLKIKNMEVMIELLEDNLPDELFKDFE
jgi:hypothetical protein